MIQIGKLHVSLEQRDIRLHGEPVRISSRAFDILELLIEKDGALVSKDEIMRRVCPNTIIEKNNLQVHIAAIRKVLGADRELIETVRGRGYRLTGVKTSSGVGAADPGEGVLDASSDHPHNLPLHASALVGRQCDVAKVLGAIERAQIVTLVGSGGMGKTGLAVEAARQLLPRFPDGVAFVSLAPMSDPRSVLDNCEHLVVAAAAAAMTEVLAAAGDGMWVLATSREALRVRDEVLCQVPPLEVPNRENQSYEALQTGAVQLFLSRARAVDPQFSSDEHSVCLIGSEVALNVAKRLVVFMQRAGGQSQFSPYLTPYAEAGSPVAQVQQYVLSNLTDNLSVSVLARVANMSVRTFARAFVRDAKVPPAEFVEGARMDAARVMLENTTIPLKTIAYKCGFKDAHRMRGAFKRRLGISPQQYRLNFGMLEVEAKARLQHRDQHRMS